MAFIAMDRAYERCGDRILQPGPSGKKTPVELLAELIALKANGTASYWDKLQPVLRKSKDGTELCYLECKLPGCGKLLKPSNPSRTGNTHFKNTPPHPCAGIKLQQAQDRMSTHSPSLPNSPIASGSPGGSSNSAAAGAKRASLTRLAAFSVPAASLAQFKRALGRFFFNNNIALRLVEDPDLCQALEALGISGLHLPSRKELAGCHTRDEYYSLDLEAAMSDAGFECVTTVATDHRHRTVMGIAR
ncbi:hypothetical protein QJQ45_001514 [Haematococcus lacustris]|nr:hypothetical protein QJQ45_001514 [Haematococcus lacustris]